MNWQLVNPQAFELGESPFWHPAEGMLYWVDISGKKVLRTKPQTDAVESWNMPSEPGCIAPARSGGLVVALRHGIFRARRWGGDLQRLATLDYDPQTMRANDGKCDPMGRFWVGTIDEPKVQRRAALYSVDCRGGRRPEVVQHAQGALTANGLAWSADQHTMYWADTPSHVVHAWTCDLQSNTLSAQRTFLQLPAKPAGWAYAQGAAYQGRPDGAAVDAQGNYYVAMYEGARVCKFAPNGALLQTLATPFACPTMPCFGGEDLRTLYLTSARHGRSNTELEMLPRSGCVVSTRVDTPGLPVNYFED